jgi:ribonucleoside-diphosphate reductase alpha chain
LIYTSPLFNQALEESGLTDAKKDEVISTILETGTCQGVDFLPAEMRNTFVVSGDVSAEEHVRIQAALQAFVDNSISKTINFTSSALPENVSQAYILAWESGCKGITVYVTGSRDKVVLETGTVDEKQVDQEVQTQIQKWQAAKKPRPRHLQGYTYSIQTPLGKTYVTINENGDSQPFEVFINTAKAGSDTAAVSEAIGRSLSYILRMSSPIPPRQRLEEVYQQYAGIGGRRPTGFGPNRVRSLPDGIAQALQEYLENTGWNIQELTAEEIEAIEEIRQPETWLEVGDLCPECGQAALVNEEGCRKCYSCGYSEC